MSEFDNNSGNTGHDSNDGNSTPNDQQNYSTDSYYSGYHRGENGEYSYVYTPKSEGERANNGKKKKSSAGKYFVITLAVILALVILVAVGVSVGLIASKLLYINQSNGNLNGEYSENGTVSNNGIIFEEDSANGTDPDISIEKQESIKNENPNNDITSAGSAYNSVSKVYYQVSDSVVEITTETVQNSTWMGHYVTMGAGSGVIIEKSGYIVTNNHVIEGANNITVRLADGTAFQASLVGTDSESDIAVIKIDPGDNELVVAELGCSDDLVVGEDIIVIGNPLGALGGTLTTGIISATERTISVDGTAMELLQTNAAINPGNSGGGLFNMAGQLVGVVNAKASGDDIEGLGFAIPIDTAYEIIEELIHYGYVRGKIDHGLTLYDVTDPQTAWRYFGTINTGVFVYESKYSEDFYLGDRIVSVEETEVSSSDDVTSALKGFEVGDEVTFTVERKGKSIDVKLTLREYVPDSVSFND